MAANYRLGQVEGTFEPGNLLAPGGAIDLYTPEISKPVLYKLGIVAPANTLVEINGKELRIPFTGVLETDINTVAVRSLSFPNGTDEDVQITFLY